MTVERPPDMTDEEWAALAPDAAESEAAESEAAAVEDGKPAQTEAFPSLEPPETDEPLEFYAQLLRVSDASGTQGSTIQAHFEAPWVEVLRIAHRYKKGLTLKFGDVTVPGASLKSQVTNTDADGAVRLKVTFTIPESQVERASQLFRLTGKGGPLTIDPAQLTLDAMLTTRAEDDSTSDEVTDETSGQGDG